MILFKYFNVVRIGIMIFGVVIVLVVLSNKMNGIGLVEGICVIILCELCL